MRLRRLALLLLSLPALALLGLPLLSLLLRAEMAQFKSQVCCGEVTSALQLSLFTSGLSALLIVLLGTPLAYWLTFGQFRGKRIVDSLVDLPVVLPPAVAGVALLMAFGREGVIGQHLERFDFCTSGTKLAVIMAQVFVSCPFYIRQARIGFQDVPTQLILASRTLGASHSRTVVRVILPLAGHALVAGLIMAWARALGEFGATLMFAGNLAGETRTMPLAIYSLMYGEMNVSGAIVLSLTLVIISFLVMVATKLLLPTGRKTTDARVAVV